MVLSHAYSAWTMNVPKHSDTSCINMTSNSNWRLHTCIVVTPLREIFKIPKIIFDAALPRSATVFSLPVMSNATNETSSPAFHLTCYSSTVHPATPISVHDALFPTHAHPRMGPCQAPYPRVSPRIAPSPRFSRAPSPRVRPSQAPSTRVSPRQAASTRVRPRQAPPAVSPTPNHLQH
jgi:hypothetical protein